MSRRDDIEGLLMRDPRNVTALVQAELVDVGIGRRRSESVGSVFAS